MITGIGTPTRNIIRLFIAVSLFSGLVNRILYFFTGTLDIPSSAVDGIGAGTEGNAGNKQK